MPLEWMTLAALTETWGNAPRKGMFLDLPATARGLLAPPTSREAVDATRWLAMQLGDTGAPELCVAVVSHRQRFGLPPGDWAALEVHRRLALLDLGLATLEAPDVPNRLIVQYSLVDPVRVQAFLASFLAPLGGSFEQAVELAIRLAALRLEAIPRPAPLTIKRVLALPHPADA
jgi:hypothetical protein